ncbi:MAG: transposase [bacterium]|nr:transposase [bacterium]
MELFHTLSRGVDKRDIFLDDQDRFRFVHDLFEFNDQNWVNTTSKIFNSQNDIASRSDVEKRRKRKLLVDIHIFCIMSNHYHLLLSPKIAGGVSKFMKKLNMGYAKYFNNKYKRRGTLFESRYKSVPVKKHSHFVHLPYYIHFNPLDFVSPEWRVRRINNFTKAIEFLESYRWSSYLDYIGIKNFPSVTFRKFILECTGGSSEYKKHSTKWLKDLDFNEFKKTLLEDIL